MTAKYYVGSSTALGEWPGVFYIYCAFFHYTIQIDLRLKAILLKLTCSTHWMYSGSLPLDTGQIERLGRHVSLF